LSIINVCEKSDNIEEVAEAVFIIRGELNNLENNRVRDTLKSFDNITHIWFFNVRPELYISILNDEEKKRANFFKLKIYKERYVFSRGTLKVLLGYYLNLVPNDIDIKEDLNGRPKISPDNKFNLVFNSSHSNEMVVYSFSKSKKMGVDIEYIRDIHNIDRVAANIILIGDFNKFKYLPLIRKKMLFYKIWTAKEACFKALGGRLTDFSVELDGDNYTMGFNVIYKGVELSTLKIHHFNICGSYIAALAVQV
jgi:4'-phosphopantetheinyl transferase